jgi:hypothetical protein
VFKQNLLNGLENFTSGMYKIALYTALANLNNTTTAYTTSNEVSGGGYTAGGIVLTNIPPASDTSNNTAFISFNNVTWSGASFTCRGALIYNGSTNAAVCVLDFGSDKVASGSFTVTFPTATSTTAVLTIS